MISLQKWGRVDLTKEDPWINKVRIWLWWDTNSFDWSNFDLDVSLFCLWEDGKVPRINWQVKEEYFIFYNNLSLSNWSIKHLWDNRTWSWDWDDEVIEIKLSKIPEDIKEIVFVTTIHEAKERKQNFWQVNNSYIHLVNDLLLNICEQMY